MFRSTRLLAPSPSSLHGKALRIYTLLLTNERPLGIREIQRRLELSSPSVVVHHLERMCAADLVERHRDGSYSLMADWKPGILAYYYLVRRRLVHRFYLYLTFLGALLASVLVAFPPRWDPVYFLFMVLVGTALAVVAYELVAFRALARDVEGVPRNGDR